MRPVVGQRRSDGVEILTVEDREALGVLGLGQAEVRVYECLLDSGHESLADLADSTGLDEPTLRVVLYELTSRELIVGDPDASVMALRSVDPRLSLTRLVDRQEAALADMQAMLAGARRASQRMVQVIEERDRAERLGLEQVLGRDRASERAATLVNGAKAEVLSMVTVPPSPAGVAQARHVDHDLMSRSVDTRMLVLAGQVRASNEYRKMLQALVDEGSSIRVAATLPMRMIIVDRITALVPIDPDDPTSGVTVLHHQSLVRLTLELFENVWNLAEDLQVPACSDDVVGYEPIPLEREVLRLLGAGLKDEAVARRVGISLRSFRRLMATITSQLDTTSRFQLGVISYEQGWTKSPRRTRGATAPTTPQSAIVADDSTVHGRDTS